MILLKCFQSVPSHSLKAMFLTENKSLLTVLGTRASSMYLPHSHLFNSYSSMPDLFPFKIASIPDLSSIHAFLSSSNLFTQLSSIPKSIPILIWLLVLNFPFQLPLLHLTVMCLLPLSLHSRAPPCLSHWGIFA